MIIYRGVLPFFASVSSAYLTECHVHLIFSLLSYTEKAQNLSPIALRARSPILNVYFPERDASYTHTHTHTYTNV